MYLKQTETKRFSVPWFVLNIRKRLSFCAAQRVIFTADLQTHRERGSRALTLTRAAEVD